MTHLVTMQKLPGGWALLRWRENGEDCQMQLREKGGILSPAKAAQIIVRRLAKQPYRPGKYAEAG